MFLVNHYFLSDFTAVVILNVNNISTRKSRCIKAKVVELHGVVAGYFNARKGVNANGVIVGHRFCVCLIQFARNGN